jgi:TPR repeat protein
MKIRSRGFVENIDREWNLEPLPAELENAIDVRRTDPFSAVKQFESLAEKGSSLAMLYIGDTYANGRGIERNIDLGDQWYQRAAEYGSIEAGHRLAFGYYHQGQYGKAVEELSNLSERGFTPAMYVLGSFYYCGTGVEKDLGKAIKYWKMAESAGHLAAARRISILLRTGEFGLTKKLTGYLKLLRTLYPYVKCIMQHPRSDRIRDW